MEKTIRTTRQIVIDQMLSKCDSLLGCEILEPSAGTGDLVEGLLSKIPTLDIDCIELNKEKRDVLKEKGFNVVGEDFLKTIPNKQYDVVIACPTYKNNIDIIHIMHMYRFLKIGGYILSLTSPHWTIRNEEHQVLFREWLVDKDYSMTMLEDNSFVENYKTQPSMLIKIYKNYI